MRQTGQCLSEPGTGKGRLTAAVLLRQAVRSFSTVLSLPSRLLSSRSVILKAP